VWSAGDDTVAEHCKSESETAPGSGRLYDVVSSDDHQQQQQQHSHCRFTTSAGDHSPPLTHHVFLAANKPTSAAGLATNTAGNPIDKLYSMQTSYFNAN